MIAPRIAAGAAMRSAANRLGQRGADAHLPELRDATRRRRHG